MIRLARLALGLGLTAAAALPCCSSSGVTGSNTSLFSSGLPEDQSFGSLSDTDMATLCSAFARYVGGPKQDVVCRFASVFSAALGVLFDPSSACGGSCFGPVGSVGGGTGDTQCSYQCAATGDAGAPCSYACSGATDAELTKSCDAAKAAACGFEAPTDASVQKACTDKEAQCRGGTAMAAAAGPTKCDIPKPPSVCTATVGEYEACMDEQFAEMEQSLSGTPACSDLTIAYLQPRTLDGGAHPVPATTSASPACKAFNDKCPGVLSVN